LGVELLLHHCTLELFYPPKKNCAKARLPFLDGNHRFHVPKGFLHAFAQLALQTPKPSRKAIMPYIAFKSR
jgi:hypothetical protein